MRIEVLVNGFSTNTYVILGEKTLIIDPGGNPLLDEFLKKEGRKADFCLLTHGHFDHSLGCDLLEKSGAKIFMSAKDSFLIGSAFYGFTVPHFDFTDIKDGENLHLDEFDVRVIDTPGHTPGSVCFLVADTLFSGDTLFAGTIGRTDFPLSSNADIMRSLKKLTLLSEETRVLPGHGAATTIKNEKERNSYLKQ